MCELCGGSHVVHEVGSYFIGFAPCPNCGPKPKEQIEREHQEFRAKLDAAMERFEGTNAQ